MNSLYLKTVAILLGGLMVANTASAEISETELKSIMTPDKVETSIGTLDFLDGAPSSETAEKVYDYLDRMRGVDTFLKGMPGASLQALIKGNHSLGAIEAHQVMVMDKLLDSKPLFLTGNTSTMYVIPTMDLEKDGPVVVDAPPGMLGAFNDAWFRYQQDIGPAGPDKGKGGKYLILPPDYKGEVPEGYFVVKSRTYRVWVFMRASIADGLDVAFKNVKENLHVYPLAKKDDQPEMEYFSASGVSFNTIHANDYSFYEHLHHLIDGEHVGMLDPEIRGLFASIGIEKGKPFNPDARMKAILTDAVAIANAAARSIVWHPRVNGNMKGIRVYSDKDTAWTMAWVNKNVFFNGKDGQTLNSDARVMFHYPFTAVTPAMAVSVAGAGSDYGIAYVDSNNKPFDGSRTYKIRIPANVPVNNFWALTMYDNQTRSQLQTSQSFPSVGSQTKGIKTNADGSYDIYFGPKAPSGFENNWLETIPGKGWFVILRMYGPLEAWIDKTWRPGEIEQVDAKAAMEPENTIFINARIVQDGRVALYGIFFNTDSASLKNTSEKTLAAVGEVLSMMPDSKFAVVGHTDAEGDHEHNLKLSKQRADAVVAALIADYGIPADRLFAAGASFLSPIASNLTIEGRTLNRRVELVRIP